jgi:Fe-S cluster assembly scaffold protein SufB
VPNGAFDHFRINQAEQDSLKEHTNYEGSYVSYLEGCTAPSRDENQLLQLVELIALDDAEIKYSTVQNWYPGNKEGKGEFSILLLREESARKMLKFLDTGRNWFCTWNTHPLF